MDQSSKTLKATTTDENILALSWNIATEPKLYQEVALNPYSPRALRILSERFPGVSTADRIKAVILAEPEGTYDRNFKLLSSQEQAEELEKQKVSSKEIHKRFVQYSKKHEKEFRHLPKDVVYTSLSIVVFKRTDIKEIEQRYAQTQRRNLRLSIVTFIEDMYGIGVSKKTTTQKWRIRMQRKPVLAGAVVFLFLIVFFYLTLKQIQSTTQHQEMKKHTVVAVQKENQGFPMRLKIPTLNVDAPVEYVGLTSKGAMDVPSNIIDVGLFKFGAYPGENGSSVIAGHFDGKNGEPGVFANLNKLAKGDKVYIDYANGISIVYVVRESRAYDPGYADAVFKRDTNPHLNLITCDGLWDKTKKSYSKRLVVFADITR